MNGINFLSICIGASLGSLLRWWLGSSFNPIFPSLPLGTLAANMLGCFLMGLFIAITTTHYLFLPESTRLAIATGFLGGLTTFSTFSAEAVTLLSHKEYLLFALMIALHVAGSIMATILGIYTLKFFI